jgi:hypothetical protein
MATLSTLFAVQGGRIVVARPTPPLVTDPNVDPASTLPAANMPAPTALPPSISPSARTSASSLDPDAESSPVNAASLRGRGNPLIPTSPSSSSAPVATSSAATNAPTPGAWSWQKKALVALGALGVLGGLGYAVSQVTPRKR